MFKVQENCQTYIQPDVMSDTMGKLVEGRMVRVRKVDKYKYFYEVTNDKGEKRFVRKESLKRLSGRQYQAE